MAPIIICCQNELTLLRFRSIPDQAHDQHAPEDPQHLSASAEKAGASNNDRGNRLKFHALSGIRES